MQKLDKIEKILIFGNGQIGNFYKNYFDIKSVNSTISDANIRNVEEIEKAVDNYKPTVVINTAAQTNLEWCASNRLDSFHDNVLGADNVAQVCDTNGIYFIHFSSGCIMASVDENDTKKETDIPDPISYYSWTKVWSENLIAFKKSPDFKYLVLRPRQPVSAQVNYKNMLMKLLTFTKFIDIPNSGTVIEDLMDWTKILIDKRFTGTLNVANTGWTTPYQIGLLLKKHILPTLQVDKFTKDELNKHTPEKRVDTVLDVSKLESVVGEVKSYRERLEDVIIQLGKNIKSSDPKIVKEQFELTANQSRQRAVVNEEWPKLLS